MVGVCLPGLLSELKLAVPWGHIAAKAWGPQQATPVLCLHGWLDNANSFDRLIPLLPKDFHYVAMDFGGHGLSSHYSPGFAYYQENFVSEVRRVVAGKSPFAFFLSYSFFPFWVTSQFTSIFPEMVDKLILLDTMPFGLDHNGVENLLTYRRGAIEHMLQAEASQKPRFLKRNSHLSEENARLLLQRGTTEVATGRDSPSRAAPERSISFVSRELFVHSIKQLQARVLLAPAHQRGHSSPSVPSPLQRFQYAKVPGNHYVHLNQPEIVAGIISAFLAGALLCTHAMPQET
uniref:Serine hydrolase like 2 n=1 Tax=Ursus maritimus TaxID=29073 RepID=A0A452V3Y3_URSMA